MENVGNRAVDKNWSLQIVGKYYFSNVSYADEKPFCEHKVEHIIETFVRQQNFLICKKNISLSLYKPILTLIVK